MRMNIKLVGTLDEIKSGLHFLIDEISTKQISSNAIGIHFADDGGLVDYDYAFTDSNEICGNDDYNIVINPLQDLEIIQ